MTVSGEMTLFVTVEKWTLNPKSSNYWQNFHMTSTFFYSVLMQFDQFIWLAFFSLACGSLHPPMQSHKPENYWLLASSSSCNLPNFPNLLIRTPNYPQLINLWLYYLRNIISLQALEAFCWHVTH